MNIDEYFYDKSRHSFCRSILRFIFIAGNFILVQNGDYFETIYYVEFIVLRFHLKLKKKHALWASFFNIFGILVLFDTKWCLKHISDDYLWHLPEWSMLIFDSKIFGYQLFSIFLPVSWLGGDQTLTLFNILAVFGSETPLVKKLDKLISDTLRYVCFFRFI